VIAKSLFSAKRHDWTAVAGTKENENSFSAGIPAWNSVQEILSPTWSREKVVKWVGWVKVKVTPIWSGSELHNLRYVGSHMDHLSPAYDKHFREKRKLWIKDVCLREWQRATELDKSYIDSM
jgi:hypothetical protein